MDRHNYTPEPASKVTALSELAGSMNAEFVEFVQFGERALSSVPQSNPLNTEDRVAGVALDRQRKDYSFALAFAFLYVGGDWEKLKKNISDHQFVGMLKLYQSQFSGRLSRYTLFDQKMLGASYHTTSDLAADLCVSDEEGASAAAVGYLVRYNRDSHLAGCLAFVKDAKGVCFFDPNAGFVSFLGSKPDFVAQISDNYLKKFYPGSGMASLVSFTRPIDVPFALKFKALKPPQWLDETGWESDGDD